MAIAYRPKAEVKLAEFQCTLKVGSAAILGIVGGRYLWRAYYRSQTLLPHIDDEENDYGIDPVPAIGAPN